MGRWRGKQRGFGSSLYQSPSQTQAAVSAEVHCLCGDAEHGGVAEKLRAVSFLCVCIMHAFGSTYTKKAAKVRGVFFMFIHTLGLKLAYL